MMQQNSEILGQFQTILKKPKMSVSEVESMADLFLVRPFCDL